MKIVDDVTSVVGGFERGCLVQPWGEERVPLTPWLEGTLAQVGFVWSRGRRICVAGRSPRGWSRTVAHVPIGTPKQPSRPYLRAR